MKKKAKVPNPARPGRGLKDVTLLTDRMKRYRANQPENRPPGPRICNACGHRSQNPRTVFVHHITGKETDSRRENLMYLCRPCNTKTSNTMKARGLGERTRQRNVRAKGAASLGAWVSAVRIMKGEVPGNVAAAVATIRATSAGRRSEFAHEIWQLRRQHGTDKWADRVPF